MNTRAKLAAIGVLAAVIYAWGMAVHPVHNYYASAVRSMAGSWSAFLFGAFDPQGSITLDKIPGGFWPQALSVRLFGFHDWSVALPGVVEAVLTVLVLYRVVARWAGETAGLLAALTLTLTPIVAALAKSEIVDTPLTLLLVLAADACQRAMFSDRLRPLLACGMWVGLAFQVKMLQAWVVLPVFAAAYLIVAPVRRWLHLLAAGAVCLAVSSTWLLIALLTPAGSRPYFDATADNSPLGMVFGYNAANRLHGKGFLVLLTSRTAPQVGWLLPLCLLAIVLGLLWTRGVLRSGFVLWGLWLAVHVAAFGIGDFRHSYYVIVLAPAVAALTGGGVVLFWRVRDRHRWVLPTAILLTAVWTIVLPARPILPQVAPLAAVLAVFGVLALLAARSSRLTAVGGVVGLVAMLITPAAWTLSTDARVATADAASPAAGAPHHKPHGLSAKDEELVSWLRTNSGGARYLMAVDGAGSAAAIIAHTGASVLPMGGFTGRTPFPTTEQFLDLIRGGDLRYVKGDVHTPARTVAETNVNWAAGHCPEVREHLYDCGRK
ncbi:ArnT family glycosyltransferase [Kutzneria sp. CA-103260]|uniref:ArnT family glycosyltransferase n=1 Tax=Kutzneria sp. CA-103260 TaxID=2802641 RepID=UPI001BA84140|nr:glycosyltransferase family 39 protein [Kutzneria sp. CA-103260]QUQ63190.1 glycosyl transferase [Kutzneria sp. CA-103260]